MQVRVIEAAVLGIVAFAAAGCGGQVKVQVATPTPPVVVVEYNADVRPMTTQNQVIRSAANPQLCFDVAGDDASQHALVRIARCRNNEAQKWSFTSNPDGSVKVTGIGALCIDMPGAPPGPNATFTQLLLCNGSKTEQFKFYVDGRIRELGTNLCLTAGGLREPSPIVPTKCDVTNPAQVWSVDPR
jgi:hypothetical protein